MTINPKKDQTAKIPALLLELGLIATIISIIVELKNSRHGGFLEWGRHEYLLALIGLSLGVLVISLLILNKASKNSPFCQACHALRAPDEIGPVCPRCGAVFEPDRLSGAPADVSTLKKTVPSDEQSRLIRAKLKQDRKILAKFYLYYEWPVTALLFLAVFLNKKHGFLTSIVLGYGVYFYVGLIALMFVIPTYYESKFWSERGKCPNCGAKFPNRSLRRGPEVMHIPDYCQGCGCRLTGDDLRPSTMRPILRYLFRFFKVIFFLIAVVAWR